MIRLNSMTAMIVLTALTALGSEMTAERILNEADARIETHRMRGAALVLKMPDGRYVPQGTPVQITQTRHAFLFGANAFWLFSPSVKQPHTESESEKARLYEKYFIELLNYCTTPLYWGPYEPQQGKPRHDVTAANLEWGAKHGITVKGHPLAWNYYGQPRWLRGKSPEEVLEAQLNRIERELTRFPGMIWDVINETAAYDRKPAMEGGPDITKAMRAIGPENYARKLYERARKADPTATLLTNDYDRTEKYMKHGIDPLINGGETLFDAIGMQSHMHGGVWPPTRIWETCERFAVYGKPIHFTETTIISGDNDGAKKKRENRGYRWSSTPEGEARQAKEVVQFYTVLFSHPAVEAITWWDFSDDRAWLGAPAGFLRADMTPKPAYHALKKLVKEAWWTEVQTQAKASGTAFRGFYGDYEVTVSLPGGKTASGVFSLTKDGTSEITVTLK